MGQLLMLYSDYLLEPEQYENLRAAPENQREAYRRLLEQELKPIYDYMVEVYPVVTPEGQSQYAEGVNLLLAERQGDTPSTEQEACERIQEIARELFEQGEWRHQVTS